MKRFINARCADSKASASGYSSTRFKVSTWGMDSNSGNKLCNASRKPGLLICAFACRRELIWKTKLTRANSNTTAILCFTFYAWRRSSKVDNCFSQGQHHPKGLELSCPSLSRSCHNFSTVLKALAVLETQGCTWWVPSFLCSSRKAACAAKTFYALYALPGKGVCFGLLMVLPWWKCSQGDEKIIYI